MNPELKKTLWRTALPLILGLGVGIWLFKKDIDLETLKSIPLNLHTLTGFLLACLFVCGRDFGLAWRFHTIAYGDLSWKRAIRTDLMCAFTSAITPSVVGGSAMAIFYLNREGIEAGRATTLTLTTLFLDELFFVVFCPVVLLLLPMDDLFGNMTLSENYFLGGVKVVFWVVYAGIFIWTVILYMAILRCPQGVSRLLHRLARVRWLGKLKLDRTADNMVATSGWVKGRGNRWWLKVFGATTLSWFSRYFVVNALFWTFVPGTDQLLVFGRQFVVWVVLMVSPTPGGSGISEWLFTNYYGDLIGAVGLAAILALVWRLLSYYIYLIIGVCLLPGYFGEKQKKK